MTDGFGGLKYVAFSDIDFNVMAESWLVILLGNQLLCLVNFQMPYKWIVVVTIYHLGTDDF